MSKTSDFIDAINLMGLRPSQVAILLEVSPSTVRRWLDKEGVPDEALRYVDFMLQINLHIRGINPIPVVVEVADALLRHIEATEETLELWGLRGRWDDPKKDMGLYHHMVSTLDTEKRWRDGESMVNALSRDFSVPSISLAIHSIRTSPKMIIGAAIFALRLESI